MAKNFFEVASAAEGIAIQLETVQNLTALFDDHLASELENLKEGPDLVTAFLDRAPMLTALLFAIEKGLTNISRNLMDLSDQAMESHKAQKGGDSQ